MSPTVIHNFRYKASVEHGNEYYTQNSCVSQKGGGGAMFH